LKGGIAEFHEHVPMLFPSIGPAIRQAHQRFRRSHDVLAKGRYFDGRWRTGAVVGVDKKQIWRSVV